jgi:FdhD protein
MQSQRIVKYQREQRSIQEDHLSIEAPLEIQIVCGSGQQRHKRSLAVTMRTPGQDEALALGFLYTEGIVAHSEEVIARNRPQRLGKAQIENVLEVHLDPKLDIDLNQLNRHFYTNSSCGVCGKASIDMVSQHITHLLPRAQPALHPQLIYQMPRQMLEQQSNFHRTGGLHGVGLFDATGRCLFCYEDVGRHNAMDKLIGAAMDRNLLPLRNHIVMVSGRASFELVQKALMAGIPVLAAVGAPSSLAVELADTHGMTLIGFVKKDSFNVYSGGKRFRV